MKQWNITITAENEEQAMRLSKLLVESFELAVNVEEPLHHVYGDLKGASKSKIVCKENRNFK
jgi:hypothetical protein